MPLRPIFTRILAVPLAALVLRNERRERSSGSELQDRATTPPSRFVSKPGQTRTHYGFALAAARSNPVFAR